MGVTTGIVEFADLNKRQSGEATSRETKESRFEASNQWSIDVALRGRRAYVICRFGTRRAISSAPGFSRHPADALNGPCHGAILARFACRCWYSRC